MFGIVTTVVPAFTVILAWARKKEIFAKKNKMERPGRAAFKIRIFLSVPFKERLSNGFYFREIRLI